MYVSMVGVIYDCLRSGDGFTFHQKHIMLIRAWLLLYIQSTVDVVCNKKLMKNIRNLDEYITIHCNAVSKWVGIVGYLLVYGTIWFDVSAITNSLSL